MVIALGIHLFPFRTEKLSPTTSMVLRKSGRVDSRRFLGVRAKFSVKEADSVLSRLFSFPTAHSLEIVFLDGEFVLHDVMFDLHVMLVL